MAGSRQKGPVGNIRARACRLVPLLSSVGCLVICPHQFATAGGGIPCRYEVEFITMPTCGGFAGYGFGVAINAENVIAGSIGCPAGFDRAASWTGTTLTIFGGFPSGTFWSHTNDVNDDGIFVGDYDRNGDSTGFLPFLRVGTAIGTLPSPPPPNDTYALAINNRFQIAGYSRTALNTALLWDGGRLIDIGKDLPFHDSQAYDVNDAGQVTGWMSPGGPNSFQAFVWHNGEVTVIPNVPDGIATSGNAINGRGDVAGYAILPFNDQDGITRHAFLFTGGRTIDLGTLPGHVESRAFGMNDNSLVVGYSEPPFGSSGQSGGFVWSNGQMVNLNDLIEPIPDLLITAGSSINAQGVIVVQAVQQQTSKVLRLIPIHAPLGDLTCDGRVDTIDLGVLLSNWSIPPGTPGCQGLSFCPADINGDGHVNSLDLSILLVNWTL